MADDAFRDILERSIDELPDEQQRVRGLRCRRHDAGEVCRVVCTHIGDGNGTSAQRAKFVG
jgi:hypothetical protein